MDSPKSNTEKANKAVVVAVGMMAVKLMMESP
jgi:hypothetical protein